MDPMLSSRYRILDRTGISRQGDVKWCCDVFNILGLEAPELTTRS